MRRLRDSDPLTVGDGRGSYRLVRFGPALSLAGPVEHVARPLPPVTVGFVLTKGDRPELVVQKLTELDVDRIVPLTSARAVVRWDEAKAERNIARWRVIAREAAAQAHRPWLPEVADITRFAEVANHPDVSIADPDGAPPSLEHPTVLVGPEGGWAPDELALARHRTRLGGTILRAETAALAAGALLVALRGDGRSGLVESALL